MIENPTMAGSKFSLSSRARNAAENTTQQDIIMAFAPNHLQMHQSIWTFPWLKLKLGHKWISNSTAYGKPFVKWAPEDASTVYHGFCFAVLCCGYTLTDFPISIRLTSLALWQSNDCPSASKATLMNMDEYFMWIHYERLHNHNKAKHNKTVCIFLGIYCSRSIWSHDVGLFFLNYPGPSTRRMNNDYWDGFVEV